LKPLDLSVDECNKLKPFHITQDTVGHEIQAKNPLRELCFVFISPIPGNPACSPLKALEQDLRCEQEK
jgi:hypothetical protein